MEAMMAKDNPRLSVKWTNGTLAIQVRGFMPEYVTLGDLPSNITAPDGPAVKLGVSTALINAGAVEAGTSDDIIHGKVMRKLQALRMGAWATESAPGINWTVFPEALTLYLNQRRAQAAAEGKSDDSAYKTQAEVQRKLITMPTATQAALYNEPGVQAEVTRILAERAKAAARTAPKSTAALLDAF